MFIFFILKLKPWGFITESTLQKCRQWQTVGEEEKQPKEEKERRSKNYRIKQRIRSKEKKIALWDRKPGSFIRRVDVIQKMLEL